MRSAPRTAGLLAGLALFAFLGFAAPVREALGRDSALALATVALMACWWISEALPLHVTSLVPLVVYPLLQPLGPGLAENLAPTALAYVGPYIFLFGGGMCVAAAIEQCGLHRRLALAIVARVGSSPARVLGGLLAATAFVSAWISNTATAAMMLPIAVALSGACAGAGVEPPRRWTQALLLAVAYGANVGGIATKIGTAPNAQLAAFLEARGEGPSFLAFAAVGGGFVLCFLPLVGWALWRSARGEARGLRVDRRAIRAELAALGPFSPQERAVLAAFSATALVWVLAQPIGRAAREAGAAGIATAHVEGGAATLAALALLAVRVRGRALLSVASLRGVSWSTLLLLGGSLAMAEGVSRSGLSAHVAQALAGLAALDPFAQTLAAASVAVALSAIASNTATVGVLLPILGTAGLGPNERTSLYAATFGASCDFALPAGTPPNALVFGTGKLTVARMAALGVPLDLAAMLVVAGWCSLALRFSG